MSAEIPNLYKNTPQVTLEQRYHGTNVTEEDIARQNEFESGVIESAICSYVVSCIFILLSVTLSFAFADHWGVGRNCTRQTAGVI